MSIHKPLTAEQTSELFSAARAWYDMWCGQPGDERFGDTDSRLAALIDQLVMDTLVVPYTGTEPKVGHWIYVHSSDFRTGGLTQVIHVSKQKSAGQLCPFVIVDADPGASINWRTWLLPRQRELAERYGATFAQGDGSSR